MLTRRCFSLLITLLTAMAVAAADPTLTHYTAAQCEGSYMPYPAVTPVAVPDSLEPVMVNHVGRHGARFPSSDKNVKRLSAALEEASQSGSITQAGRSLLALCRRITEATAGQWGALDSLGMAEQRGIASRMYRNFPSLFAGGRVMAESSYSPRCIMSMYVFAHQLSRLNNKIELTTSSGRQNSPLLRPFDSDAEYREFRDADLWRAPIDELERSLISDAPLRRVLGKSAALPEDSAELRELAMAEYAVVACASAIGIDPRSEQYFTSEEYNRLWACSNLRHYLQYSASTISTAPAEMAAPLLANLIGTTCSAVEGNAPAAVMLRFGHAETLMPLLALMHLPGCYYMTNYFDTVAMHWRDFYIVPMAANLQLILLRHKQSGAYYIRVDLNETPVPLIPGRQQLYTPWPAAEEYLTRCLPILVR